MKTPVTIFAEIRKFCRANGQDDVIRKYAKYFTEGYDAYGVDPRILENQRDLWMERYRLGLQGYLTLGDLLVKGGKHEEAGLAIWFVASFKKEFTPGVLRRLGSWLDTGLANWALTDFISGEVLSRFLVENIVPLKAFSSWRKAQSRWKRRSVPVSMIKPLKAGGPVEEYLEFIEPMMEDRDRVVQQGLGWFLREAWKRHPAAVEEFLMQWKNQCGRIIVQYATERMAAGEKMRFKKVKPAKPGSALLSKSRRRAVRS